ncbi:NAD(P)/FAD-dependent oxidoreductase [Rhodococcus sp. IEGM 1366]|uniref:flavin-containing monooxygenase n=1 Tax=Rhodococcus sp. IEGM 1366 TaxID=3082223 RepID=UPI002954B3EC|nr:NAD(P)/FAD-dependent oxidoreductase [Rhodococcus sp. IEGM 1366]MDV8071392.1 NAD(P)/FAD-dependent oxidoreductase [Rhodococcus sp. IEGM 1366]
MKDFGTVVIGAGFSGLAMGLRLRKRGIADFVILERSDEVGGVWRDNTYPGVGVDTPSKIYALSTDPNPNWSRLFARGDELLEYTRQVARRYDLVRQIRFNTSVNAAHWDPAANRWRIETDQGTYTAQVLITAAGLVADASLPAVPGVNDFEGEWFHSSNWNHHLDLIGRKVAVIGTGASAIQFVPEIAPDVAELHVVQRTPSWVRPKDEIMISKKAQRRLARFPALLKLERAAFYGITEVFSSARRAKLIRRKFQQVSLNHLNAQVPDPELRAKLLPDFEFMCKRPLVSNDFYPALQRPNVELHTGGLTEVRANSVITGNGEEVEVDTIIYNTGFDIGVTSPIARVVHDAEGRTLADHWGDNPRAYKGVSVPGFPNLFVMQGPNATSGVSSSLIFAEAQALYIASALRTISARDIATFEVKASAEAKWTKWVRKLSTKMVYETGGCVSYYLNSKGDNVVMWPTWSASYQLRTRTFDADAYHLVNNIKSVAPKLVTPSHESVALA